MRVVKRIAQIRKIIASAKRRGKTIGLVPTMGYLHEGHLSLVRLARRKVDFLVVSIFVNPTQFGPREDFGRYPRDLKRDLKLLRKEKVDLVFNPSVRETYSDGHQTYVEVVDWSKLMCGASRPVHFRGVTTVVLKLFNILEPDIGVFGSKDFQQAAIIKKMVKDLNLRVKVVTGKIVREKDGLAMSSRNRRLQPGHRRKAGIIFEVLQQARDQLSQLSIDEIKKQSLERLSLPGFRPEYFEIVDADNLQPVSTVREGRPLIACTAVWAGDVRLIDNLFLQ